MGVLDYMGDAPGFMSYRRQPQTNVTNIPQRQAPQTPQYQGPEFDIDLEANPGDKQYLYNQQMNFNNGVSELYKKYGGEMDWVTADPEYAKLAQGTKWEVYDKQAAEQNKVNTDNRIKDLKSKESGQHDSDFELVRQGGVYVPIGISPRGGFVTKGQYTQNVIEDPQLFQRDDGSVGVQHVEFDYGTGDQKSFHEVLDNIYAGDSRIGVNKSGTNQTDANDNSQTTNLKWSVGYFHNEGYKSSNNYEQLNEATQYLIDYGFDDNQKYYLWQSFYKDVEQGKPFKMPRTDENGYVRRKDGSVIMDDYQISPDDLQDPDKISMLFNGYVQDRVIEYSEKFRKREYEDWRTDKTSSQNIDKYGNVIEEEQPLRRWEGVTKGFYPKNNAVSENVYTRGSEKTSSGNLIYDENQMTFNVLDRTNFPVGMDQAETAVLGKNIDEFGGNVYFGGKWMSLDNLPGGIQVGEVLNVREIPNYEKNPDGTVSTMGTSTLNDDGTPKVTWGATVRLYADDDEGVFGNFSLVNPETGTTIKAFKGWGDDNVSPTAENLGIAGLADRSSLPEGTFIYGDQGTGYTDYGDHKVQYIDVVIPIEDAMLNWDEYNVGETRSAGSEEIQTRGSVIGTMNGLWQEGTSESAGTIISEY